MEYSHLFSGLLGAILGIISTYSLYRHHHYSSAKRNLEDKLIILKHDVTWEIEDGGGVSKTWDANLKEIWVLYNALSDFVPFWKKRGIQSAWEKYKGGIHIKDKNDELQIWDSKMPPRNKTEFLQNITSFLKALE